MGLSPVVAQFESDVPSGAKAPLFMWLLRHPSTPLRAGSEVVPLRDRAKLSHYSKSLNLPGEGWTRGNAMRHRGLLGDRLEIGLQLRLIEAAGRAFGGEPVL